MPPPRRRSKKRLIDFSGTQKTIDILRDSYIGLEKIQSRLDADAENIAHSEEIRRCRRDIDRLPIGDPERISEEIQLWLIASRPYFVWRKFKLGFRAASRIFRKELTLAFLIPLQMLLIAACNVVGFALLWWILFSF